MYRSEASFALLGPTYLSYMLLEIMRCDYSGIWEWNLKSTTTIPVDSYVRICADGTLRGGRVTP